MARLGFYQVVGILFSANTSALGVANRQGIIVGISEGQDGDSYAVLVGGRTYMVRDQDLESSGLFADRSQIYGGDRIAVDPERYEREE